MAGIDAGRNYTDWPLMGGGFFPPKTPAATDLYSVLMNGLNVSDRLHRFDRKQSRKLAQVAKAEAKFW